METNPPLPTQTPTPASDKPAMVQAIAIMTLVNGILNILWGVGLTFGVAVTVVGLCVTPITILPAVLGIFEIIYAAKLLPVPAQPTKPNQTIAILEIVCILVGNVFSAVVGILALVFYNDPQVKEYFAKIGG